MFDNLYVPRPAPADPLGPITKLTPPEVLYPAITKVLPGQLQVPVPP
jgi:hypothetical protein